MLFVLVLLFIFNGQVILEKSAYKTLEECQKVGIERMAEQEKDPKFDAGLYANCIPLPGQAVKS